MLVRLIIFIIITV